MADPKQSWKDLVARVRADEAFKARLLADPMPALREVGIEVPPGVEVRVVENTANVQYVVLPAPPVLQDLEVAGAADIRGGAHKIGLAPPEQWDVFDGGASIKVRPAGQGDIFGGGAAAKAFSPGDISGGGPP